MRNTATAYIFWIFGLHYAYLGKWATLLLFWITIGGFGVWMIIDAIRMPFLVRSVNGETKAKNQPQQIVIHNHIASGKEQQETNEIA